MKSSSWRQRGGNCSSSVGATAALTLVERQKTRHGSASWAFGVLRGLAPGSGSPGSAWASWAWASWADAPHRHRLHPLRRDQ